MTAVKGRGLAPELKEDAKASECPSLLPEREKDSLNYREKIKINYMKAQYHLNVLHLRKKDH